MKSRSLPHIKLLLVNIIVVFAFTGCATTEVKLTETGFLSSYSDLEVDGDSGGMHIYKNLDVNIAERYSKILIAPVQFILDPTLKGHKIKDEDREKMANYFIEELKKGLSANYTIVDVPGKDTLLLRAAVTDILPNKVLLNLHYITTFTKGRIGGASLEAEVVDSLNGDRMMSFVDARKGKKVTQKLTVPNYAKGLTRWGNTKAVLKIWADLMVENLDRLRE